MARKPIFKTAMTATEYQRRWRAKKRRQAVLSSVQIAILRPGARRQSARISISGQHLPNCVPC